MNRFCAGLILFLFIACPCLLHAQVTGSFRSDADAIADGDNPRYSRILEYIKQNKPAALVPFLKDEYLDDKDFETRIRIISALKLYPAREYADVWTVLLRNSDDKRIEIELIDFLGLTENNPFIIPIAEKVSAPRAGVRSRAAQVLGVVRDDRMLPEILSLGNSSNPVHRIYFLEALNFIYDTRFQKTVISLLDDENKSVRIYAMDCVIKNDIKNALPQVKGLLRNDSNFEVKKKAIAVILHFRDTSSAYLVSGLINSEERELRLEAVRAVAELKYSSAAHTVSAMLLTEQDSEVKNAALDALYVFKRPGVLEGLEHILKKEPSAMLRVKAAFILGELKEDPAIIEILDAALQDSDYRVRGEICNALGNFRRAKCADILFRVISKDTSRYVRTSALYSIVRINDSGNIIRLFDVYTIEKDMVFRMLLHDIIRSGIEKNIR
ncbi:MAG: HEAT repeat domain-containing protein [Spirochaetes bacterium]|nr:HEAT repeat domain-containing protein [Spirochaetota bacterium]